MTRTTAADEEEADGLLAYTDEANDDSETLTPRPLQQQQQQRRIQRCSFLGAVCCIGILSMIVLVGFVTSVVWKDWLSSVEEMSNTKPEGSIDSIPSNVAADTNTSRRDFKDPPKPPVAHREEHRVVYAGIAPAGWDLTVPRQALGSSHSLLDPPVPIPDPYGWLRDETRQDSRVLQHLEAENNYTKAVTHTAPFLRLKDALYSEMKSRLQETSHTFPVLDRQYYYYQRNMPGQSYPLHCRSFYPNTDNRNGTYLQDQLSQWDGKPESKVLPNENCYLDENRLAKQHDFFHLGDLQISPSQELVAYTVDVTGNELYYLVVQEVSDNGDDGGRGNDDNGSSSIFYWEDTSLVLGGSVLWSAYNDDTLFYTKMDETQRVNQVYRRKINFSASVGDGRNSTNEELLLYAESNVEFWVDMEKTTDQRYLLITTASSEASEVRYLDLLDDTEHTNDDDDNEMVQLKVVAGLRPNVLYSVDHRAGIWWMISTVGDDVSDFQLWIGGVDQHNWKRVQDPTPGVRRPLLDGIPIEDLTAFENHIVVQGREDGMKQLWILAFDDDAPDDPSLRSYELLDWDTDPAQLVELGVNLDFSSTSIVVQFESLVTPLQYVEVDLNQPAQRLVLLETPVPGYKKDQFACDQIQVTSRDGNTKIPVSLVYRKDIMDKASNAGEYVRLHLYAYGAYGFSVENWFSASRISLLNRGIIYAVAHVRGGGELGRAWYEDGKYLNKKHTFDDIVDVASFFVDDKMWTTPSLLSLEGRSAGGMTIGAAVNQAPHLFRVAILGVPFVDVVATMIDATIPLTSGEWDEWGNPNEEFFFDYMMQYSPMNNVQMDVEYPSLLLLAGLYDPRVQYWEPAKFAQALRFGASNDGGDRPICLKTDMTSGHFSASDRYKNIDSKAFDYAFVLLQLGVA